LTSWKSPGISAKKRACLTSRHAGFAETPLRAYSNRPDSAPGMRQI
jgi:hypothetical protein